MTRRDWLRKISLGINWRFLNLDVLLLVFFSVPIVLLYISVPSTFQGTWKGRFPYLFFIWLLFLETFLSRHKLPRVNVIAQLKQLNVRFILSLVVLLVPTAFALWENMSGGRDSIISLGRLVGAPFPEKWWDWPLAFESLTFAFCFAFSIWLSQNRDGLRRFKVSLFFISAVAVFFMTDAFYHGGTVWFFQLLVPPIGSLAAFFLDILGYNTITTTITTIYGEGYLLAVGKAGGSSMNLLVYWPCAGVHSLIIYTIVILLFFKNLEISSKRKSVYLAVGAVGTFMANIFRIVSIAIIGVNTGHEASRLFHAYYGELFFVVWIVVYLIAVFLYESRHETK